MPCLLGRGNTSDSVRSAEKYATAGLIDSLDNLREKRHYIYHGTQDAFIHFGKSWIYSCDLPMHKIH